jgi:molybdenum cofactor cytidylyltransferase
VDGQGKAFAVVVLAAGAGARFSSQPGAKLLADLDGRPVLEHVLAAVRATRPVATVVVLGHASDVVERAVEWESEIRVINTTPERGLASSLQVGMRMLADLPVPIVATFIVLGDQPRLRADVMQSLSDAATADEARRPLIVPRYRQEPGPRNPALLLRHAWGWVDELDGDRGLSALMDARPDLILEVPVAGSMPDVDEPADLSRLRTSDLQP